MYRLLLLTLLVPLAAGSQPTIDTAAGNGAQGYTGDGGAAISAMLNQPRGVSFDRDGNLLIADFGNHVIRRVDRATGDIETIAGNGLAGDSGDGVPATSVSLRFPAAVLGAPDGSVYIADQFNSKIKLVTPDGMIQTIAGTGFEDFSGDGGPGTSAELNRPSGLALDADGNLLIADFGNSRIRLLDRQSGTMATFAGSATVGYAGDGGDALSAQIFGPFDVDVDSEGNVFIADNNNHAVRRVDRQTNIITTVIGDGMMGGGGDGGLASNAQVSFIGGIALDARGDLFVADHLNTVIRRIDSVTGMVERFAGSGVAGTSGDGGDALAATMQLPWDIAISPFGELHIALQDSHRVRFVTAPVLPEGLPAGPAEGDQLGAAVAVEGTLMVVGVPAAASAGANTGQVLVYQLESAQPDLVDTIDVPAGFFAEGFGTSVAIRDGEILIGTLTDPVVKRRGKGTTTALQAALMERVGQSWQIKLPLSPSQGTVNDQFGASVAFAGDLIVIGAPNDGDLTARGGAAHVFQISGNTVLDQALIKPPGLPDKAGFGIAVAGQSGRLAIGASGLGQAIAGSVTLATMISNNLSDLQVGNPIVSSTSPAMDGFGGSLALSGDRLIVGAPGEDTGTGAAFVFDVAAATTELRRLTGMGQPGEQFGASVSFADGDVLAGAPGQGNGAVFVFDRNLNRRQIIEAPQGSAGFGTAVAGSAAVLLTGAPVTAADAGAAFAQRRDNGVLFVGNFE